jgi:hypothetical protein
VAYKNDLRGLELAVTLATFTLLVLATALLGLTPGCRLAAGGDSQKDAPWLGWIVVGSLLLPYLLFALGNHTASGSKGALRLSLSSLCLHCCSTRFASERRACTGRKQLAILAIWCLSTFAFSKSIWVGKVTYGFNTLLAVNLALLLFVCFSRVEDVGYHFRIRAE